VMSVARSCFEPRRGQIQTDGPFARKPDANGAGRAFERPPDRIHDATNERNAGAQPTIRAICAR